MKNRNIPARSSNALIAKLNANDIYDRLMSTTQQSQVYPPEFKKSKTQTKFNPSKDRLTAGHADQRPIEDEATTLAIELTKSQGVQYFTLFNKKTQKEYQIKEVKLEKIKKIASEQKPKSSERRIRTCRKENIHLESVLGKLLVSFAQLKPQLIDPNLRCEKGKRQENKKSKIKIKSSNVLLFSKDSENNSYFKVGTVQDNNN